MANDELALLNELLRKYPPGALLRLPATDAIKLGNLGRFSLGDLWDEVEDVGVCSALENHGLFGRQVVVMRSA